eukprot:COSAG02_NODE_53403_length_302_cov_0.738916_1_plen_59_part_10
MRPTVIIRARAGCDKFSGLAAAGACPVTCAYTSVVDAKVVVVVTPCRYARPAVLAWVGI